MYYELSKATDSIDPLVDKRRHGMGSWFRAALISTRIRMKIAVRILTRISHRILRRTTGRIADGIAAGNSS